LHDLQQVNEIAESLSGKLNPSTIAGQVTDALVVRFDCAFARIWLVEPNQRELRLVASSGLYTHINGSFARVPMGAFKVGKIAQNRVPFLSNQLAEEPWVKDRQWALDNEIQGFAGYPLVAGDRVLGVLASFSHAPYAPEFLEVLQVLCMTLTVALDAALQANSPGSGAARPLPGHSSPDRPLSDRLAQMLGSTKLTLVGTERSLRPALNHVFLQCGDILQNLDCSYCRLTYTDHHVMLEAVAVARPRHNSVKPGLKTAPLPDVSPCDGLAVLRSHFSDLNHWVTCLGGTLQAQPVMAGQVCQISLILPAETRPIAVQVRCRHPLLHQGFSQLVHQAGLMACDGDGSPVACITDTPARLGAVPMLWVRHDQSPIPDQAAAILELTISPEQLRQLVEQVIHGKVKVPEQSETQLSEREQQVMQLLAEGKRDRNIAAELYISESTVKFHINNSLTKLKAKNRYQGVYQAAIRGWI
jgi:DNA-binding CsgD family transcriptional regulator